MAARIPKRQPPKQARLDVFVTSVEAAITVGRQNPWRDFAVSLLLDYYSASIAATPFTEELREP
jgi:hypothetical protein